MISWWPRKPCIDCLPSRGVIQWEVGLLYFFSLSSPDILFIYILCIITWLVVGAVALFLSKKHPGLFRGLVLSAPLIKLDDSKLTCVNKTMAPVLSTLVPKVTSYSQSYMLLFLIHPPVSIISISSLSLNRLRLITFRDLLWLWKNIFGTHSFKRCNISQFIKSNSKLNI